MHFTFALAAVLAFSLPFFSSVSAAPLTMELEIRGGGGGGALDAASFGVEVFEKIFTGITDGIAQDKIARGDFTQAMVTQLSNEKPAYNFVICHTKHETKFDGAQGTDWYHDHREFDVKIGGTIGYEIYGFKSGEFFLKGDGGFLNWAYIGNVKSRDGGHVVFGTR